MATVERRLSTEIPNIPPGEPFPGGKKEEYSIVEIALSFIRGRPKDVLKVINYSIFWAGNAIPNLHPKWKMFNSYLGETKNLLGALEVPDKAYVLLKSLGSVGNTASIFKNAASLTNSVCEGIDFSICKRYITYDPATLRWVRRITFAATYIDATIGVFQQYRNLKTAGTTLAQMFYMINLARDLSYMTLGTLGLCSEATETYHLEPWIFRVPMTSGLAFSIGSFFYESVFDPENKGKNLNPMSVFQNVMDQRNKTKTP